MPRTSKSGKRKRRSLPKRKIKIRIRSSKNQKRPLYCVVDGCKNKCLARGYCSKHYNQIRAYGKIKDIVKVQSRMCVIVGCTKKQCAHRLCNEHHQYYLLTYVHSGKTWEDVDRIIAESNRNSLEKRDRLAIIKTRHEIIKNAREAYFRKLAAKDELLDGLEFSEDDSVILEPDDLDEEEGDEDAASRNGEADGFDQVR